MARGTTTELHWWQTRTFVACVALASIIPLLWPEVPPLVDLPGHMGRYRVQLAIGDNPWLSQWYDFRWQLIGNLGIDLLIVPLAPIFGCGSRARCMAGSRRPRCSRCRSPIAIRSSSVS
jgi:hypothetical protein